MPIACIVFKASPGFGLQIPSSNSVRFRPWRGRIRFGFKGAGAGFGSVSAPRNRNRFSFSAQEPGLVRFGRIASRFGASDLASACFWVGCPLLPGGACAAGPPRVAVAAAPCALVATHPALPAAAHPPCYRPPRLLPPATPCSRQPAIG